MRAAIFNPYLDTLGGGERYSLAVCKALVEASYSVDVFWKDESIRKKLESRFGMKLSGIEFVADIKRGDGYDVCFWVSDGSIPLLRARKNFLHFQFPFKNISGNTLINKMKLFRINKIICNSNFTKDFIDKEYGVKSVVLYPPVDVSKFKSAGKKEKIILSVARFSQLTQSKRQDVLIDVFKRFYDLGNKDWRLVLAGGVEVGVGEYVEKLKKASRGYPISILEGPDFKKLVGLYAESAFFWTASGFGISEQDEPVKVEHFGITVVEAMAAGAVPFVYNAGGHREIIKDGENGFLWSTKTDLLNLSLKLVKNKQKEKEISSQAKKDAKKYSYDRFKNEFLSFL